jgi:hypothetical protein
MTKRNTIALAALLGLVLASNAVCKTVELDVRPGPGVTQVKKISAWFRPLAGTNLDTDVYVLDSGKPGATGLMIGGTHGNELAGSVAAVLAVENVKVTSGKLIVIPHTNRSAASVPDTRNPIAQKLPVQGRSGERYLTYGDRRTDPADQGAEDPDEYVNPGGYTLENGAESRNLNRTYPGKADGTRTEQLAYAILQLVHAEQVDFSLDMHEAGTPDRDEIDDDYVTGVGKRLSYTLVTHPDGLEVAAFALLAMEEDTGISMKLEESNSRYRGLSHLEIGDHSDAMSFLSESPNPGQDRWRNEHDVVTDPKYPLTHRAGLHLRLFKHLADSYADMTGKGLAMEHLPEYDALMSGDIGQFLN